MTNQPNAAQTPPTLSLANVTDDLAADLHFAIKALSFLVDYDEVEEARAVLKVTSDKGDDHLYLDAAAFIEKALG